MRLLEQNHRNLEEVFEAHFGHLPEEKSAALYGILLLQAYHGDIALGMILHNLGRNRLGFASLYYVTDVSIATQAACARLDDLPGC